jgi:Na+-driven multidrug efflux pump
MGHWNQVVGGIRFSLSSPLGLGTASTNIASDKFGAAGMATEADISNAFVSLGLVGGVIYLTVIVIAFARVIVLYRRTRDVVVLGITGVMIIMLGQWLNGGQYAVAPLIWFLIGWASQERPRSADPA